MQTCKHCDITFQRPDDCPIPADRCERCHEEIEALAPSTSDPVNRPSHYTQGSIECIDAIGAATVGKSGIEAVCTANVIKYLWRYERKNGVEDVRKARWYLERLIKELEHD